MMHQFVIDIGNSRIKTGTFNPSGELIQTQHFGHGEWEQISNHLTNLGVQNIIYSTVANEPPKEWIAAQTAASRFVWTLDRNRPLPFRSTYQTMRTIGKDRLAALAGAMLLFPAENCLVVDAGTCVTFDLLAGEGTYHGGNISPGLRMRLHAMHAHTARLPLVTPQPLRGRLGQSTETALLHGGLGGLVYELEGLYRRLAANWPGLNVVLTGGDAQLIADHVQLSSILQPNLVLYGLHKILTFYADTTV